MYQYGKKMLVESMRLMFLESAAGKDASIRYTACILSVACISLSLSICVSGRQGKYKYLCGKQQAFCQNICVSRWKGDLSRSNPHFELNRFLILVLNSGLWLWGWFVPEILFTHPILFVFIDACSQIVLSHSVWKKRVFPWILWVNFIYPGAGCWLLVVGGCRLRLCFLSLSLPWKIAGSERSVLAWSGPEGYELRAHNPLALS